jgi:hypothetical protein
MLIANYDNIHAGIKLGGVLLNMSRPGSNEPPMVRSCC